MQRILVVEDNEVLRQFVAKLLELEGYSVLEASDGDEGLALARQQGCDLVLLDIQMPRRDGWSVLEVMKGDPELRDIPVVMWTATANKLDEMKARSMGASDYLAKPVTARDLLASIQTSLSEE